MKVLFLAHYDSLYGANRSLFALVKFLGGKGIQPYVIVPQEGELSTKLREENIDFSINMHHLEFYKKSEISRLKTFVKWVLNRCYYYPKLEKEVKALNPQVLYSNSATLIIGSLLARKLSIKHVWHFREFGSKDYEKYYLFGSKRYGKYLQNKGIKIFISKAIEKHYQKIGAVSDAHVIYNGVFSRSEIDRIIKLNLRGKVPFSFGFLILGHLMPTKGQLEAIDVFDQIQSTMPSIKMELNIVGDGEKAYKKKLIKTIKEREIENVNLHGYLHDASDQFQKNHFLLMFSKNEAFGRVTVEAMAYGLTVLGLDSAGTSEIVNRGINGFLFKDLHELPNKVKVLIANPGCLKEIGRNAQKTVRENYSIEESFNKVYQLLTR